MDYKHIYYPESKFGGFTDVDGTIAFYIRVNCFVTSSSVLLDVGCGKGDYAEDPIYLRRELRVLKGKCRKVIGIDVDPAARENPFLDEFRPIEIDHWPMDNESVDVCLCDNVVEHVEDPDLFFSECQRVIKQGGYLCIRTPNVLSYFGLFSRIIPNRFHLAVVGKVQSQREGKPVFPTRYRCNTEWKMCRTLNEFGFDYCVYGYEAEPSYLSFSRFFYYLGVLHQRFAPKVFKTTIFAFGKKK